MEKQHESEVFESGQINLKTVLYDTSGNIIFLMPRKVWYSDSLAIQEIARIDRVKPAGKEATTIITPLWYRFVDLPRKKWYDYRSLSDTAKMIKEGSLPDSIFTDQGWTFYSDKNFQFSGMPEELGDTVISGLTYRRFKFAYTHNTPKGTFRIGFYRCDNKGAIFSLEKKFSKQIHCSMTKLFEYRLGYNQAFASQVIEFISDSLSEKESKVFESWKRNAGQNQPH